mmetsp:Transcript_27955/g.69794  ORF Transcript_27955/g.69794 Transcript_27955/m.69794 type:complete len:396 (+) Transcript_27955:994-2181(+)
MSYRMADAEECVSECESGDGGGIVHVLAGGGVGLEHRLGQVVEYQLDRTQTQGLGVVRREHGHVGLQRMSVGVVARERCQTLWHGLDEVAVHDGHVGCQAVGGDGVLGVCLAVRDDRKRGHLGTSARRRGDHHQFLHLAAQIRKLDDALADVEEARVELRDGDLGVLVHQAHDLGGVHGGAAAECDHAVGLVLLHTLHTRHHRQVVGVGLDVGKHVIVNATSLQGGREQRNVSQRLHGLVGDDECLRESVSLQVLHRLVQDAAVEVDGRRHLEPQHVLATLRHLFVVEEVFDRQPLGRGVHAPRAAPEGQRWAGAEVVEVSDGALAGGHVDEHTAGGHAALELGQPVLEDLGVLVAVQTRRVAHTAVTHTHVRHLHRRVEIRNRDEGEAWAELFV